jgi:DNA-binding NtrC family response regulator
MIDRAPDVLSPFAEAILDAFTEGVLVFDYRGRLAYANAAGRAVVAGLAADEETAKALLPRLARIGGRIAPIWIDGAKFGEAVYLPPHNEVGRQTLAERERLAIVETLDATGWKLTESARQLGISRTTLWRRLRAYGLERDHSLRWPRRS